MNDTSDPNKERHMTETTEQSHEQLAADAERKMHVAYYRFYRNPTDKTDAEFKKAYTRFLIHYKAFVAEIRRLERKGRRVPIPWRRVPILCDESIDEGIDAEADRCSSHIDCGDGGAA